MADTNQIGVNTDFIGNQLQNKGAEKVSANAVVTTNLGVSPANNFTPPNFESCSILLVTKLAVGSITGLIAPNPLAYKEVTIVNSSTSNLTLSNNDANSLANNRFLMGGNNIIIAQQSIKLFYDVVSLRWRIISKN